MTHMDDAQLDRALAGLSYPCKRGQVLEHAAGQGASDAILGVLGALPEQDYDCDDTVRRVALNPEFSRGA